MTIATRTRYVNSRLGVYFGIFMSAFVALAVIGLMLEELGLPAHWLKLLAIAGPIVLYIAIGAASWTTDPLDYFASGRRVSAIYSGLALAVTALGGTGLLALTGAFFISGFDALCISIGALSGFVVMAVLLAPFVRKFGAFTMASYLGRRFESRFLRVIAAACLAVPLIFVLAAELSIGAFALSLAWPQGRGFAVGLMALALLLMLIAGGMRSLTWTSVAQGLAMLFALMVAVVVVAIIVTNLPIPQLSAGPVLRLMGRAEVAQGLPSIVPPALAFDLPSDEPAQIMKRFSNAMGSVGPFAFVIVMWTMIGGLSSAPWLLPRVAATPSVYDARKSLGWATLLFGVTVLTLAAAAIFLRDAFVDVMSAGTAPAKAGWLLELQALGLVTLDANASRVDYAGTAFERDGVLLALPIAAGLPASVFYLGLAGAVAAALAAGAAAAVSLANTISEDVVFGLSWDAPAPGPRLMVARVGLAVALALGAGVAILAPTDPLKLLLWAHAITAACIFPVLVLSIWWKRLNVYGATAGLVVGFGVAVMAITAAETEWSGVPSVLAAALAVPAAFAAATGISVLTPAPGKHTLELVRDIRVPGGEILYDREIRLEELKKRRSRTGAPV